MFLKGRRISLEAGRAEVRRVLLIAESPAICGQAHSSVGQFRLPEELFLGCLRRLQTDRRYEPHETRSREFGVHCRVHQRYQ